MSYVCVVALICATFIASLHSKQVAILNDTVFEFIKDLCQYETLCSSNDIGPNNSIQQPTEKCCKPCLCTADCVAGNCCPGSLLHPVMRATCRSQYELFNRHRGRPVSLFQKYKNYFVVDTCPPDTEPKLSDACAEPDLLEDHVLVSTLDGAVVFKNARCAVCNGVVMFQKWNILLHKNEFTLYNDIKNEWKEEYDVYSVPKPVDRDIMSVHECIPSHGEEVCYVQHDQNVQTDCTEMQPHLYSNRGKTWANIFCFICMTFNRFPNGLGKKSDFCHYEEEKKTPIRYQPLTLLIDPDLMSALTEMTHSEKEELECELGHVINPVTVSRNSCLLKPCQTRVASLKRSHGVIKHADRREVRAVWTLWQRCGVFLSVVC